MAIQDSESYHRRLRLLSFCENGSAGRWHGYICANAGIDTSNTSEGEITLFPKTPIIQQRRFPTIWRNNSESSPLSLCRTPFADLGGKPGWE